MNKIIKTTLLLAAMPMLFACGNTNNTGNEASLKLNATTAYVEQYETIQLTYKLENYKGNEEVTWESLDTSIATVDDGIVTGINIGQTTISVSLGDLVSTCSLTVTETTNAATLVIEYTEVSVGIGLTPYSFDLYATYMGNKVDATFEFAYVDGNPTDLITYHHENSKFVIDEALKAGVTRLSVSTIVNSTTLCSELLIEVVELD